MRRIVKDATRAAAQEGKRVTFRRPEEVWEYLEEGKIFRKVHEGLQEIQNYAGLPAHTERQMGGKPSSWITDAVALALRDHFQEQTGSPKWAIIEKLLGCAPAIPSISYEAEKIRQRLVRGQREERAPVRHRPTLSDLAFELKRAYREGVERMEL
jgi:hypothetical protein